MIAHYNRAVIESGRPLVTEEASSDRMDYAWSMIIRFPIRDETGTPMQVGGFILDISRPKLAEAEVKASAERFRTIAEIHPTPMIITRLVDREVLFANRSYFDTFRVAPDTMADFDRGALYVDRSEREAIYADIAKGERIDGREITMLTATGQSFPSVLTARGIDYEGSAAVVMSFLDLSELKRAEAALRVSEQRFRSIAQAHPMPLVIIRRRDGRLLFANQPFRELFQPRRPGAGGIDSRAVLRRRFGTGAVPRRDACREPGRRPRAVPAPHRRLDLSCGDDLAPHRVRGRAGLRHLGRRSDRAACRGGGDPAAARDPASEREAGGTGRPARGRRARAEQSAVGGRRLFQHARGAGPGRGLPAARGAGACCGRALRQDRQDLPRHGPLTPAAARASCVGRGARERA